jgi:hypothetical protein
MRLRHGRITLALHDVQHREGLALLLLHPLYASSAFWSDLPVRWPGPIFALDFAGHGASDHVKGGAYYTELLIGDADAALAQVGAAALMGAGIGAYVAALLAGSRREQVPAALLWPGAGLAGGGPVPDFTKPRIPFDVPAPGEPAAGDFDPWVRALDREVRPPEYAAAIARPARRLLFGEIASAPPWWEALRRLPCSGSVAGDPRAAMQQLLAVCGA